MTIEASRSALVIIDMQSISPLSSGFNFIRVAEICEMLMLVDFFLDPGLSPKANAGRGVVNATVNMIKGFRKAGMKVLWTNVCSLILPFPPLSSMD